MAADDVPPRDTRPAARRADHIAAEERIVRLTEEEAAAVDGARIPSAAVSHEIIRRHGLVELNRSSLALMWSGLTAGLVIGVSVLAKAVLHQPPIDGAAKLLLGGLGYSLGFVLVVLGRMQLFTESTITAVLPVATHPSRKNLRDLARLWAIVFVANMVGTFLFALGATHGGLSEELRAGMVEVSRSILHFSFSGAVAAGVPAGFLIAALVWIQSRLDGERLIAVVLLTGLIDVGHFAHVVAGSAEAWILALTGEASLGQSLSFVAAAFLGNVAGGSLLFSLLAHAQVRSDQD